MAVRFTKPIDIFVGRSVSLSEKTSDDQPGDRSADAELQMNAGSGSETVRNGPSKPVRQATDPCWISSWTAGPKPVSADAPHSQKNSFVIKHIKLVPRDTAVSWGSKGTLMDVMATGEMELYANTKARAKGEGKGIAMVPGTCNHCDEFGRKLFDCSRCDTSDPPKVKT